MKIQISKPHREGEVIPMFYLPVYEEIERYAVRCWIFPLAPFVLFYKIIKDMFWILWRDLLEFQRLLIKEKLAKHKKG